jgi:hypothetical protein
VVSGIIIQPPVIGLRSEKRGFQSAGFLMKMRKKCWLKNSFWTIPINPTESLSTQKYIDLPVIRLRGEKRGSQLAVFDGHDYKMLSLKFILDHPHQSYREFVCTKIY